MEKNMAAKKTKMAANIVWFEVPADDMARAKKFYHSLFGWKINPFPNSPVGGYEHIDTGGPDASPDGGLMQRMHPEQPITNYVGVASVARFAAKIKKLAAASAKNGRRWRAWVISLFARTQRIIRSRFGK